MENTLNEIPSNKWLSVPLIATITRLLCRELTLQNEYFQLENKILKSKLNKRITFTDDERRACFQRSRFKSAQRSPESNTTGAHTESISTGPESMQNYRLLAYQNGLSKDAVRPARPAISSFVNARS